jgi:adenylate cyclase
MPRVPRIDRYFNLPPNHPLRRVVAVAAVALAAVVVTAAARFTPRVSDALRLTDVTLYDAVYRLRPDRLRHDAGVAVVTVDDTDLKLMEHVGLNADARFGWPWPRELWGMAAAYLEACGAKVVAFDLLFDGPSVYNDVNNDDVLFAGSVANRKIPVIFGALHLNGAVQPLSPWGAENQPPLGVVTVRRDLGTVLRSYEPLMDNQPLLGTAALRAVGVELPAWATPRFDLHYHGPTVRPDGRNTYLCVPATKVLAGAKGWATDGEVRPEHAAAFKDRVVFVGATAAGAYDLKSSPVDPQMPAVFWHVTAVDNVLSGQRVRRVAGPLVLLITAAGALLSAVVTILPRRVWGKLLGATAVLAITASAGVLLFTGANIDWLPLSQPLMGCVLATIGGIARSYLSEDRRSRFLLGVVSASVSPDVAEAIERDPKLLQDVQTRELTILFSDLAGFTDFTEVTPAGVLKHVLDSYMERMTAALRLQKQATIDKLIGDAIMAFWNAPLDQANHADLACSAALLMRAIDRSIGQELIADPVVVDGLSSRPRVLGTVARMGRDRLYTRIGIHTGPVTVGFMGSRQKTQYTAIGDTVNTAARLEPANKVYGTRILVSQTTIDALTQPFVFRRVDVLRVKGKSEPTGIYELRGEGRADDETRRLIAAYDAAFAEYQRGDFAAAERSLVAIVADLGDDPASAAMLRRVRLLKEAPPPNWDGVYTATEK